MNARTYARMRMRPGAAACLPLLLCGCQAYVFQALMWGEEPGKPVKAEYPYLQNQTVAILVRAEMDTLFEYPHVQLEVAEHVRVPLEANVKGVKVISPRRVVDLQRSDPSWERTDPARIGADMGAQRVIEIALTQYSTRDPESPHIYRGHIQAVVNVYNCEYTDHEPAFTTDVLTKHPPDGAGVWNQSERAVRRAAMEAFGQDVAEKFYDHVIKSKVP